MASVDLKTIREALDKSQNEFATLLGLSVRAVQSYEQGWRPVPQYVLKLALLIQMFRTRKGKTRTPCWEIRNCKDTQRNDCPAYQLSAGEFCWIVTGTLCGGKVTKNFNEKLEGCQKCKAFRVWMT